MKKSVKPLKIGFDFDGVIIDHTQNKIQKARDFGFDIKPDQILAGRLKKIIGPDYYRQLQRHIYGPGTASGLVAQGAFRVLEQFRESGYEMFIISRRQPKFRPGVLEWLARNIPGFFDESKILFVRRDYDKDIICRQLKIQIYIDDKVSVLRKLTGVPQKYFYDPYNIKDIFKLKNIKAVSSWSEFLEYLKSPSTDGL